MDKQDERRIASEIMKKVRKLNLPLKLDEITEGRGNCFPLSVLAQCRRPEIYRQLDENIQNIVQRQDPTLLRQAVSNFMSKSRDENIINYKKRYEEILSPLDSKTWKNYWEMMIRNYEWVDYIFIQSTAWFLGHDIIIVTTTSTEEHPFLTISGNLVDENTPCQGVELTIGSMSQVHYQSLLPITFQVQKKQIKAGIPEDTIKLKNLYANPKQSRYTVKSREDTTNTYRHGKVIRSKTHLKETSNQNLPNLTSLTEFSELDIKKDNFPSIATPLTRSQLRQDKHKEKKHPESLSSSAQDLESKKVQRQKSISNLKGSAGDLSSKQKIGSPERQNKGEVQQFKYKLNDEVLSFQFVSDKRVSCPKCGNNFKNILNHIQKS